MLFVLNQDRCLPHYYLFLIAAVLHKESSACLWLRLQRQDATIEVQYSFNGENYTLLNTAYLSTKESLQVGLVCACPEDESCQIAFENFLIETESDRCGQRLSNSTN